MMRLRLDKTWSLVCSVVVSLPLMAQPILEELATPDSLKTFIVGVPTADDYGAVPYGASHVLFSSNRDANAFTTKDPITHKPFTKLYLMSLKDRSVTPYKGNDAIQALKYHVGPAALLPDSSGIIVNHSRQKPNKKGDLGMTLSFFSFSGEPSRELSFVQEGVNYLHPYFDEESYTLFFAADQGKGGDYDLYETSFAFDGAWSEPMPVAYANSPADEVFPSVLNNNILAYSRATKNYGLQLFTWTLGDTAGVEMNLNGRGDDFNLTIIDDSTAMISQSKRKGDAASFIFYTIPAPEPVVEAVAIELTDTATADSTLVGTETLGEESDPSTETELTETESTTSVATKKANTKWVTDDSPAPGSTKGFSLIVGGFMDQENAEVFLEGITGWAPESFIARHNDKYYVVHSVSDSRDQAERRKSGVTKRGNRAWILSLGLQK